MSPALFEFRFHPETYREAKRVAVGVMTRPELVGHVGQVPRDGSQNWI
jgi:hypothetical protein